MSLEFLYQHWYHCWQSQVHDELFDTLVKHYQESHRHYHNLNHLYECFSYFDDIKNKLDNPKVVALALFYHDVIYNLKSNNNEQNSGELAKHSLSGKVSPNDLDKTYHYILATKHHKNTLGDADLDYLLDIDLAILGADLTRFKQYNHQIRQEYQHVCSLIYYPKRHLILKQFYQSTPLFITPYFYQLLEKRAKANLKQLLTII